MLGHQPTTAHYIKTIIIYIVFGVTLTVGTFLVVALARGYNYDFQDQEVVREGLIRLESRPETVVFVDGENSNESTPVRITLREGTHKLNLFAEDYYGWEKQVEVEGGVVQWITYPFLIRADVEQANETVTSLENKEIFFSPSSQFALLGNNLNDVQMLALDNGETTNLNPSLRGLTPLDEQRIEQVLWSEEGALGLIRVSDTENNTRWVRFNADQETFTNVSDLVDIFQPLEIINYQDGFVLGRTENSSNLFIVNLSNGSTLPLSASAKEYDVASTSVVWRDDNSEALNAWSQGEQFTIPVLRNLNNRTNIEIVDTSNDAMVAYETNGVVNVIVDAYTNPYEQRLKEVSRLESFSPGGGYLLAKNSLGEYISYDLETLDMFAIKRPESNQMKWVDANHLLSYTDSTVSILEFDGANEHTLINRRALKPGRLSVDKQFFYIATENSQGDDVLSRVPLQYTE